MTGWAHNADAQLRAARQHLDAVHDRYRGSLRLLQMLIACQYRDDPEGWRPVAQLAEEFLATEGDGWAIYEDDGEAD